MIIKFFFVTSPLASPSSLPSLVVSQQYETDVNKEHVIRGNAAILKCVIPSFVADFVSVTSWVTDAGETFFPSQQYGNDARATSGLGR